MMCGIRSFPMMMGANRMMQSTTKKISVGSVMGKYWEMWNITFLILCAKLNNFSEIINQLR